jgi:hypothetical protein
MPAERRRRAAAAATVLLAVAALAGACSSEPEDPAEARRDRIEARLEDTFSRQQSDCILEQLDDAQLEALDLTTDLEDPAALEAYSNAAVACVVGLGG